MKLLNERLKIKWKLFIKIDRITLSLGCHVLTNIVSGSLFSWIRSRNNSFLSIFSNCFIVVFNSFAWSPRSINFYTRFYCLIFENIYVPIKKLSFEYIFGTFDGWQDEAFRQKRESVDLVNSVVLNFPCFTSRKWTSLLKRWISNLILDFMFFLLL